MIGQQLFLRQKSLHQVIKRLEIGRAVNIRHHIPNLATGLGKCRPPHPARAAPEIQQNQHRVRLNLQLRGNRQAHIGYRRKRRYNQ